MLAPEWHLFLTSVGVMTVAVFALFLGMKLIRAAKRRMGMIPARGLARHVRFRYRSANGVPANLMAIIYEIEQRSDRVYFHGLCLPGRVPRTFRADRVENLIDLETGKIAENIDTWLRNLAGRA